MFSFILTANCFPKWLYHFAFPPVMNESSCCSTSLPVFGVVSALDFGHSNKCVVVVIIVLIYISLMTYKIEHLFICFICYLYIFLGEVSFGSFANF